MLKFYGVGVSNNVNKVRFVANALGLDYELQPVNLLEGEQRSPEFLDLNPVGKVPVMQDGEFTLFESMAISKYLANKENSSLYPQDLSTHSQSMPSPAAKLSQCFDHSADSGCSPWSTCTASSALLCNSRVVASA